MLRSGSLIIALAFLGEPTHAHPCQKGLESVALDVIPFANLDELSDAAATSHTKDQSIKCPPFHAPLVSSEETAPNVREQFLVLESSTAETLGRLDNSPLKVSSQAADLNKSGNPILRTPPVSS